MLRAEILEIHRDILAGKYAPLVRNPMPQFSIGASSEKLRPNSAAIGDLLFGDSGKGSTVILINQALAKSGQLFSVRWNGGGNAGHEAYIHGLRIVAHNLPMATLEPGATALMSRGMVIHPADTMDEIKYQRALLGEMPGKLMIDENALLCTDLHRALETLDTSYSTGSGIARAYADQLIRKPLTIRDLMSDDWREKLSAKYKDAEREFQSHDKNLAEQKVKYMEVQEKNGETVQGRKDIPVGSETDFLNRLAEAREFLRPFVKSNVQTLLSHIWHDPKIPVTFEGAQGPGLHPDFGVFPDVTASRPLIRDIGGPTYGVVEPFDIALRAAVMKTGYMSEVGSRELPQVTDPNWINYALWLRGVVDETGRTTGNLRGLHPIHIPAAQFFRQADCFDFLVATHLDSVTENFPVTYITNYVDKFTGEEVPYSPYQYRMNQFDAQFIQLPGWDGAATVNAKSPEELPENARIALTLLGKTIGVPVIIGKTGPEMEDYVSNILELKAT